MSRTADGQDKNGLQLEKIGPIISTLSLCLRTLAKTLTMVYLFENHLISSSYCSISFSYMAKVLSFHLGQF